MTAAPQIADVLAAFDVATRAGGQFQGTFRSAFPQGAAIKWERNGVHEGVVAQYGHRSRLKVTNAKTGATYWVSMGDVMRAYGWKLKPEHLL